MAFLHMDLDIKKPTYVGDTIYAVVEITEPCTRCAFTALGQPDLPFDKDVLHAIAKHGGGGFGVLAKVVTARRIASGDAVSVEQSY